MSKLPALAQADHVNLRLDRWPELVGLPWKEQGRDRAGVDCWGAVRMGLFELAGLDVPSYAGEYLHPGEVSEISRLIGGARQSTAWSAVAGATVHPLDVAVFRRGRFEAHLGLVLDPRRSRMLHAAEGHGTRIESWLGATWLHRLSGFYRHAALAEVSW